MRTDILYQPTPLKSGDTLTKTIVGYLGPKNYDDLKAADTAAGFSTGFNTVIDFGWFAFIGRPLLWLLQKFRESSSENLRRAPGRPVDNGSA